MTKTQKTIIFKTLRNVGITTVGILAFIYCIFALIMMESFDNDIYFIIIGVIACLAGLIMLTYIIYCLIIETWKTWKKYKFKLFVAKLFDNNILSQTEYNTIIDEASYAITYGTGCIEYNRKCKCLYIDETAATFDADWKTEILNQVVSEFNKQEQEKSK